MKREDVLKLWQEIHGPLSPELRRTFRQHPLLPRLAAFDRYEVELAFRRHKKLQLALELLQRRQKQEEAARARVADFWDRMYPSQVPYSVRKAREEFEKAQREPSNESNAF